MPEECTISVWLDETQSFHDLSSEQDLCFEMDQIINLEAVTHILKERVPVLEKDVEANLNQENNVVEDVDNTCNW